jgi:hypothetical protein
MPDNGQNVKKDMDILSDWVKCVRLLIQMRNKKLNGSMSTHSTSIFKNPIVAKHLSHLNDKYVVIPAGKAPHLNDKYVVIPAGKAPKYHWFITLQPLFDIIFSMETVEFYLTKCVWY